MLKKFNRAHIRRTFGGSTHRTGNEYKGHSCAADRLTKPEDPPVAIPVSLCINPTAQRAMHRFE